MPRPPNEVTAQWAAAATVTGVVAGEDGPAVAFTVEATSIRGRVQ